MSDHDVYSFLESRKEWLQVRAVSNPAGGWDVALILDGPYSIESPEFKRLLITSFGMRLVDAITVNQEAIEEASS